MLQIMPASVPNFCDATSPSTLESDPDADIVVAGFPCQTFSGEGKGVGLDDPRGMVVFSIILYVARRLPKVIIFENVADLLNTHSNCLIKIIEAIRAIKDPATGSRAYWVTWKYCKPTCMADSLKAGRVCGSSGSGRMEMPRYPSSGHHRCQ